MLFQLPQANKKTQMTLMSRTHIVQKDFQETSEECAQGFGEIVSRVPVWDKRDGGNPSANSQAGTRIQ